MIHLAGILTQQGSGGGGSTPSFVSSSIGKSKNGNGHTNSFTASEGDLVLAFHAVDWNGSSLPGITSSGWTLEHQHNDTHIISVWSKVMGATPDSGITFSAYGGSQRAMVSVVFVITGQTTGVVEIEQSDTSDPPSATVSNADSMVLAVVSARSSIVYTAGPSGYSNFTEESETDTIKSRIAVASKELVGVGSEDPGLFTPTSAGQNSATLVVR